MRSQVPPVGIRVPIMNISSFCRTWILAAALMVGGLSPAFGQLIEFKGLIDTSTSSQFAVGDVVELSLKLRAPLSDIYGGFFAPTQFLYKGAQTTFIVGGTTIPTVVPLDFGGIYNANGLYGTDILYGGNFVPVVSLLRINFSSTINPVTSPDGIFLPGLPISAFEGNFGQIFDATGTSSWHVTNYAVSGNFEVGPPISTVPEASTYAVFAGMLLALIAARRVYSGRRLPFALTAH